MNKPQILIIEDDNAIGNLISTTLETQHYQYRRAKNGASGVLEAASCRPDVILLDLGLPDMDGVDIIKKVRTWSNTPIIVISARSEDHDKVEALDAGADDYLTKPFSVEELLARLRVSLRRVRYDSEKVDEAASRDQNLPERRAENRLRRRLHLPEREGDPPDPHRVQAAVPAGPEHRQGAHPQLHSQQDLERRPALRHPLTAGVYGHAAQEDRARSQPPPVHPDPHRRGLPDDPPARRGGRGGE